MMITFPPRCPPAGWLAPALVLLLSQPLLAQGTSSSEPDPSATPAVAGPGPDQPGAGASAETPLAEPAPIDTARAPRSINRQGVVASLTIFVLAIFVGFEVITKVPPTLHTPLMSGSNAISGITLVGALVVASATAGWFSPLLGCVAVALATINVVGGFLVTHRMLAMFKRK
jgi:NAD(P) transhydrogenase subunit alpha